MSSFGERVKQLREQKNLLQRHVAGQLDIDTPMLSKIERGERRAKREQVLLMAKIYEADKDELLTLWLSDRINETINNEPLAGDALKLALEKHKKT